MTAYPPALTAFNVIPIFRHEPLPQDDHLPIEEPRRRQTEEPRDDDERFFEAPRQDLDALISLMKSTLAMNMDHAQIEHRIDKDGMELLRKVLQSHLELRAHLERRGPITGADGVTRTQLRKGRCRDLVSLFGDVEVHRIECYLPGKGGLRPMDAELNLTPDAFSFGVRQRAAWAVARLSFDEATTTINSTTGARIAKRQLEQITQRAAVDFDEFYATRAVHNESTQDLLVLTTDGKGVVMRPESLRPATRKAAQRNKHKLNKRLSGGEKRSRKRMAQVVSVYSLDAQPRCPEDIIYKDKAAQPPRPRPTNKRVWASLEKSTSSMVAEAFKEGLRRDPNRVRRWVGLVDGNLHQLEYLQHQARALDIDLTLILDIIHVLEYVWGAAWSLYPKGAEKAEKWVTRRLLRLLEGKAASVAAGMRRSATMRGLTKEKRKGIDACADYLLKYARLGLLAYDQFLAAGLPIATGVIEGACRYLVQDRMGITGARWGLAGGESVLKLRALHASGDWDAYWAFHRQRELERNHLRFYEEGALDAQKEAA